MEPALKQRLVGALVISALAIVFLPRFIVGHDRDSPAADVSLQLPGAPDRNFETRELPLTSPGSTPPGGVVGMNANAPPLPGAAPVAMPAPTDANGKPLPIDPNAPAVVATVGAHAATSALPTTQAAQPADQAGAVAPAATLPSVATATSPSANPKVPPGPAPVATTPVAAPPDAPIPAAHAGGNYVVSVGTYSNPANAQSLVRSLQTAHLPAYMESVSANGKPGTRVRIGPYAQRGDAEAARLHAQQVRSDMPASVTALETATEAPAAAFNSAAAKPALVAPKPAAVVAKPVTATTVTMSAAASAAGHTPATAPNAKAASPAPASPAAAGRGYVIQVSAYRTEEEALALRNRLRAAGFTAFSERVQLASGTLYRVRVGPTADRDAAEQLRVSLSQKMGLSGMVVAYP